MPHDIRQPIEKPITFCFQIEYPYEAEHQKTQNIFQCIIICFDIRDIVSPLYMLLELCKWVLSVENAHRKEYFFFSKQSLVF